MKAPTVTILCGLLVVAATTCIAQQQTYDLSTPEKAIRSFLEAAKKEDLKELEKMISPSMKERLRKEGLSLKDYAKAWSEYPLVRIVNVEPLQSRDDPRELASADVVFLVNGQDHEAHVGLIKIGGIWLWDEK